MGSIKAGSFSLLNSNTKPKSFMDSYRVGSSVPSFNTNPEFNPNQTVPSLNISPEFGASANPTSPTYGASLLNGSGGLLDKKPDLGGGWMDKGKFGLGVAQVGLGIYNAMEQTSLNNFMKGYYSNQMAMQKTDFGNAARSTNEQLEGKRKSLLSAQGMAFDSDANKKGTAAYMKEWGAKENYVA